MEIPIRGDMATQNAPVEIRLEERTEAEFNLARADDYVNLKGINGRLILDFEVNRGEVMDNIKRVEDSGLINGLKTRINMFLEGWTLDPNITDTIKLNYGTLLLEGTEPIGNLEQNVPLIKKVSRQRLKETSPSDLKRELRQEVTYSTTYEELIKDIKAYLEREGLRPEDFEFGVPFQIQAEAEAVNDENEDIFGTKFTIGVKNSRAIRREYENEKHQMAGTVLLKIDMPPEIGRQINKSEGEYDSAKGEYRLPMGRVEPGNEEYIQFVVPVTAGRDLEELKGDIEIEMETPFTYLAPTGVFDPGGKKIDLGSHHYNMNTGGKFEASFYTETSEILKRDLVEVSKKFTVEGITPPDAVEYIDNTLRSRSISASWEGLDDELEPREGTDVRSFHGEWINGSTLLEDTRISVDILLSGYRSSGERRAEMAEDGQDLPTTERSVTMSYGETGVRIDGRGADQDKIDDYVSDLRDEIKLRLENNAMEV